MSSDSVSVQGEQPITAAEKREAQRVLMKRAFKRSPSLHFRKCLSFYDDDGKLVVKPDLTAVQKKLFEAEEWMRLNGFPFLAVALKGRRAGSTTGCLELGYTKHRQERTMGAIIADDKAKTGSTIERVMRIWGQYVEHDTFDWGNTVGKDITKCSNGSILSLSSAREGRPEQGGGLQWLVFTEYPQWPQEGAYAAEKIRLSVFPALSKAPGSIGIIEGTANGQGNDFCDLVLGNPKKGQLPAVTLRQWKNGERGNGFILIAAFWWEDAKNQLAATAERVRDFLAFTQGDSEGSAFFREMREKTFETDEGHTIRLSEEQLLWIFERFQKDAGYDVGRLCQEYPHDVLSAFLASGRPVFDQRIIQRWTEIAKATPHEDGILTVSYDQGAAPPGVNRDEYFDRRAYEVMTRKPQFEAKPQAESWVRIWKHAREGESYLISGDTSLGEDRTVTASPDRNSIIAWQAPRKLENGDWTSMEQVARIIPPDTASPEVVAFRTITMARYYGDGQGCIIVPEVPAGWPLIDYLLQEDPSPRIYSRDASKRQADMALEKSLYGWLTNVSTRQLMVAAGQRAVNFRRPDGRRAVIIHCPHMLDEMAKFVWMKGKAQAMSGNHDDDVLSWMIALMTIGHATRYIEPRGSRPLPPEVRAMMMQDRGSGSRGTGGRTGKARHTYG